MTYFVFSCFFNLTLHCRFDKNDVMKKIYLCIILSLFWSNISFAEWNKIHSDQNTEHYIDMTKLKKEGTNIHFWHLVNYLIQNEDIFWKSSLTYTEVNCNNLSGKDHVFNFYSEKLFRLDGMVWTGDTNINVWLVKNGWSFYLLEEKKPTEHNDFLEAENEAKQNEVGLWESELQ